MLDFSDFIADRTRDFTGREWVFQNVDAWLADAGAQRVFLLAGGPGTGKSSVAARVAQMSLGQVDAAPYPRLGKGTLAYFHFCQAQSDTSLNPLRFVESLSAALANRYEPFAKALLESLHRDITVVQNVGAAERGSHVTGMAIQSLHIGNISARAAFDWAVRRPLETLCTPSFNETIVVLIDSMDEALAYNQDESIPQLLADATSSPQDLPGKVRFLLTSRPDPRITGILGKPALDLIDNAPPDADDVYAYAQRRLGAISTSADIARRIANAGKGNFLYARYVLDELAVHAEALADPATVELPDGLGDVYRRFIRRELARSREMWGNRYRPLLGLLAVARSPGLTRDHLAAASGLLPSQTDDALAICKQYLAGNLPQGPFSIYHQSFRDFLLEDPEYSVYPGEAEQVLGRLFSDIYVDNWTRCEDPYALRNTPGHLARAALALAQPLQRAIRGKLTEALERMLMDFGWLLAKLNATDIAGVIADYELLPESRVASLIRDALRLSAHVLAGDKTQLAGQLLGRLLSRPEPEIQAMLAQAAGYRAAPWLRPLVPSLDAPGGALERTVTGHGSDINGLTMTPDGKRLISASSDKTLKVWDLEAGVAERTLTGHSAWVSAVTVTPTGDRIISASWDKTLRVWNLRTGALERTLTGHESAVLSVAAMPDGVRVVSGSADKTVKVWNLDTGAAELTLSGHADAVNAVAVTRDGARVVSASRDRTLKVWRLPPESDAGPEFTLEGHARAVEAVAITPDGGSAISASEDGTLIVWDLQRQDARRQTLTGHGDAVRAVAVTLDGTRAISASTDRTIKIWNLPTGQLERTLTGHTETVKAVAVTSDGKRILSGSRSGSLKVWNISAESDAGQAPAPTKDAGMIAAVAVAPDGLRVLSASGGYTLKLYRGENGTPAFMFDEPVAGTPAPSRHTDMIAAIAVTPDGARGVSASADGTLKVWDMGRCAEERTLVGHTATVRSVAVLGDGTRAVSASWDRTFRVWNLLTGETEKQVLVKKLLVNAITAVGAGLRVAAVFEDPMLRIWDLETGELEREILTSHLSQVSALAVTPDGKIAVTGSTDTTLRIWDVAAGVELGTLEGHRNTIVTVAMTDDGLRALSASRDFTARVWDLKRQVEEHKLAGHTSRVYGVAATRDGKLAITVSEDQTAKVWNLADGRLVATFTGDGLLTACAAAGRSTFLVGDASGRVHFLRLEGTGDP